MVVTQFPREQITHYRARVRQFLLPLPEREVRLIVMLEFLIEETQAHPA
jgi:hypothetical protein